jgi:hypothetical protein
MSRLFLELEYLLENILKHGKDITSHYVGMLCETGMNYLPLTLKEKL